MADAKLSMPISMLQFLQTNLKAAQQKRHIFRVTFYGSHCEQNIFAG
jgi:hypothetical protein